MLNKYDGYTVGPNLRQLRKDKKLSVYQVSELTGLSNSSINQIEQGGRGLSMNGLYLLMDAYQCDANKLLNIEEFKEKIFHVHFKDIKLLHDKMQDVGIMATPLQFMVPKLPGLGDVNWNKFVSALTDIGFDGPACIEIEDKSFEKTDEKIKHAVAQATKYMKNFV